MEVFETDVLVVGAAPAGLTASALLARAGVRAIGITKYPGTADSPRNQRTAEVLRDLGVEDRLRQTAMPHELMETQIFATSFAGLELSRAAAWGAGVGQRADYQKASPSSMCNISQHKLEPIILEAARRHGADIRFNNELVDLQQDRDGVSARIVERPTGREREIHCKYLIGADGGRSTVASKAGFEFDGRFNIGKAISVWLDADLTRYTRHRSGAIAFIAPQASEIWMSIWPCVTPWTEWNPFFFRHGWAPGSTDEDALQGYIREAIGDPTVPFKIKKISPWQVNHVVAKTYRCGRVFLAGDAAHRHSPAAMKSHVEIEPWSDAAGLRPAPGPLLTLLDGQFSLVGRQAYSAKAGAEYLNRRREDVSDFIPADVVENSSILASLNERRSLGSTTPRIRQLARQCARSAT